MPEGLGARLAIENGFLILLAIGAAVADLEPLMIVLVMAIGWILVVLVEVMAWRARPQYAVRETVAPAPVELPPLEPEPYGGAPPEYAAAGAEPAPEYPPAPVEPEPEREPVAPVEPVEEAVVTPEPEAEPEPQPEPVAEAAAAAERTPESAEETAVRPVPDEFEKTLFHAPQHERVRVRLEPLQPRPRRRVFRRTKITPPEADGEQG
jgi:outer membrane biosynthesis protein TonB